MSQRGIPCRDMPLAADTAGHIAFVVQSLDWTVEHREHESAFRTDRLVYAARGLEEIHAGGIALLRIFFIMESSFEDQSFDRTDVAVKGGVTVLAQADHQCETTTLGIAAQELEVGVRHCPWYPGKMQGIADMHLVISAVEVVRAWLRQVSHVGNSVQGAQSCAGRHPNRERPSALYHIRHSHGIHHVAECLTGNTTRKRVPFPTSLRTSI